MGHVLIGRTVIAISADVMWDKPSRVFPRRRIEDPHLLGDPVGTPRGHHSPYSGRTFTSVFHSHPRDMIRTCWQRAKKI